MFRALRKAAVTVGLKKNDDQDATDMKRLSDLRDANEAVKRQLTAFIKSTQDDYVHAATLHEALADLYPHGQEFTAKLDTLASKAEHFKTAKDQLEEARKGVEDAYNAVSNKHKELAKLADERAGYRQDIKHYEEKIPGLEAKAKTDPKPEHVKKLEENQKKMEDTKAKFAAADAALVPELEKLDGEVAAATTAAFRAFLEAAAKLAEVTATVYRESLAATESPAPAAPAEAAPAQ